MEQEYQQPANPYGGAQAGFFDEVDSVKHLLAQYDDYIENIEILQRRSLAESRSDEIESLQRQIDTSRSEAQQLAESIRDQIKHLESVSYRDATKQTQADNLKQQFMSMIQKFQATEAAFRQRYRDVAARQYRIVEPEATDAEVQQAIDEDPTGQVFSQALMQSNRRGEARSALTEVQIRHREIQKIEATLGELAQLFHDMEVMVAEQDQQVTNIQQNVFDAQHDIEKGVDNQFVAVKKARAWRKKKWWCAFICLVIVLGVSLGVGLGVGLN